MNIVFMGTPEFAVPSLKALIDNFNVMAVFTQPDKPKGRGKKLGVSPVKELAEEYNIPIYQPTNLKKDENSINALKNLKPDFIIVVAYGQLLSKEILDIPAKACINLHASLLPKYRGAAPINWAIIGGEHKSGNTTMLMAEGLDTGDMLLKDEVIIGDNMTAGELHDILMHRGSELLVNTIHAMANNEVIPEKQNDEESCYASMLNKDMACIDWQNNSKDIHNRIRGLNPWPIAYTFYQGKMMKIYKSKVLDSSSNLNPGTIVKVSKHGVEVATGEGKILIEEIQFPNSKPMKIQDYLNGNTIEEGQILGN